MRAEYIIYYRDKNDSPEGYEVTGTKALREALKWLHSDEVKASSISIYKRGKNFDKDQDDVIEVQKYYWK